jgi:hypothetical protein
VGWARFFCGHRRRPHQQLFSLSGRLFPDTD